MCFYPLNLRSGLCTEILNRIYCDLIAVASSELFLDIMYLRFFRAIGSQNSLLNDMKTVYQNAKTSVKI